MAQTLIEQLQELIKHSDNAGDYIHNLQVIPTHALRAIIEQYKTEGAEKQDIKIHNGYIEGTAERLRLICSKLGIGAPVSNEEIMFCQFSLFGAIRRKIDALYTAPQPAIVAELVKALEEAKPAIAHFSDYWHDLNERDKADKYNTMLSDIAAAIARAKAMTE